MKRNERKDYLLYGKRNETIEIQLIINKLWDEGIQY